MIDHIEIPGKFLYLAGQYHSGQDDLLYAISSSGGLYTGGRRPSVQVNRTQEDILDNGGGLTAWQSLTDEEWYLSLWVGLASDVRSALRAATGKTRDHDDADSLQDFEEFCDKIIEQLRAEYHLEDSDVV